MITGRIKFSSLDNGVVTGGIAVAFFWGVVSVQHYLPSGMDFYINTLLVAIISLAMTLFFARQKIQKISYNCLLWLIFFLLLLIQPLLHQLSYFDAHLLEIAPLLAVILLVLGVAQFTAEQKANAVKVMAYVILFCGVYTVFSQLVQLLQIEILLDTWVFDTEGERLVGNVAQVNQAAFVCTLAMAALIYLLYEAKHLSRFTWTVAILIILWLSMGIGFSASRGGVLLAIVALLSGAIFYQAKIKQRAVMALVFFPVLIIGYTLGTYLMNAYMQVEASAIGRMMNESSSLHLRISHLHQAWLAFSSQPITGIGWGGIKYFGLQHADEIEWFTVVNHVHNIVAQLAAELGFLGVTIFFAFVVLLLKNLRFSLPPYRAFSFAVLMLLGMYSLSEYPLWYMRFLLLTAFFVAIIDVDSVSLKLNSKILPLSMSALLSLGAIFYAVQYKIYTNAAYIIREDESVVPYEYKVAVYKDLPSLFGFSQYKELILFLLNPISEENIEGQIALGNRILSVYLADFTMLKQANILMVAGKEAQADILYQSTCLFNFAEQCNIVIENLRANAKEAPEHYQPYYERFAIWYESRFDKKIPE